jgi:hypothetical protein
MKRALLASIAADPPRAGTDVFFHDDLRALALDELRDEQRRLQLRLLLTDRVARARWPASWLEERARRIDAELRARGVRR